MFKNWFAVTGRACLVLLILFSLSACANKQLSLNGKTTPDNTKKAKEEPQPQYLDFGDILIPSELKINVNTYFVLRTSELTAGVLALRGRVDLMSLVSFFEANMRKDNWKLISIFKSPKNMMLFRKDLRWCVINVFEGDYYTHAEVWVSPTIDDNASGLFK